MLNALLSKLQSEGTGNGPLSAKTVRYIHTTVHRALEDAVDSGVLAKNTAERAEAAAACSAVNWFGSWESHELAQFLESVKDARLAGRLATRRDDRHAVAARSSGCVGDMGISMQRVSRCARQSWQMSTRSSSRRRRVTPLA